ncbi:DUF2929 family protein [Planococcaceae bacterium Storch 2/2-2]|nr:DUF2929 family protein [Planococcaceae bacterium Storch 2/2-2]
MRFIMTFVWSFALVILANYVAGAIKGRPFVLADSYLPAALLAVFVFLLAAVIPKESTPEYE